jgi:hypothetical protein
MIDNARIKSHHIICKHVRIIFAREEERGCDLRGGLVWLKRDDAIWAGEAG